MGLGDNMSLHALTGGRLDPENIVHTSIQGIGF